MIFNSFEYAIFLPVVLILYYCASVRAQNWILLIASFIFYGWWDYRFLFLISFSIVMDYYLGRTIEQTATLGRRKLLLLVSVCANLTILGFFKYFNFFLDSTINALNLLGMDISPLLLQIVLPVGISFYTFQSMSYTIDVYRRELRPCTELSTYALYVAFFPQLVAGPIERATHLIPQLTKARRVSTQQCTEGCFLILVGLFKKIAIADSFAPLVDVRFTNPELFHGADLLCGAYLFAIQIYCDFSGYTDVARGSSKLLGIELMQNFAQPYFSRSITEFWRRWHISLSTWLRDYLYIPLGGNRYGTIITYRNLMLTMLIGGAWHGANWTYIFWGGLHGFFLALDRRFGHAKKSRTVATIASQLWGVVGTFHLVCLAWIFFRAESFSKAMTYLAGIFDPTEYFQAEQQLWSSGRILILLLCLLLIDAGQAVFKDEFFIFRFPSPVRGLIYGLMVVVMLSLGGLDANVPFIYFQF